MPWREVYYMEERLRFIAAVLAEEESMTSGASSSGSAARLATSG